MRTTTNVHSPEERLHQRRMGEAAALQTQWRLVACVSILRTAVTRVIPLAGAAGWWVILCCLLPGLALYALARLAMRRTHAATIAECARSLAGRAGAWAVHILAAALLLVDGACTLTALITLFTQGVGTQGTQLTLTVAALIMLIFCLNREGLARGIYLLRTVLGVLLAAVLTGMLLRAGMDRLWPVLGDGKPGLTAAFMAGAGMGWPFLLPLMNAPVSVRSPWEPLPPAVLCTLCLLLLNLAVPHEVLITRTALADSMLQTVTLLGPFLRLCAICLWMLTLFLSLGSAVSMGAGFILAPCGREHAWLPGLLAALLACTQAADVERLWSVLGQTQIWLLLPFALCVLLAILACGRRRT